MITKADTAELITYLAAGLQGSTHPVAVTPATVEVWHRQFAQNNVGHKHIVLAAIDRYMGSDASRFGVVPADIITRYKSITTGIAGRFGGWELLTYEQRQAVLADPVECDYSQGVLSTSQYESARANQPAIAPPPITDEEFDQLVKSHGMTSTKAIGRMPK